MSVSLDPTSTTWTAECVSRSQSFNVSMILAKARMMPTHVSYVEALSLYASNASASMAPDKGGVRDRLVC